MQSLQYVVRFDFETHATDSACGWAVQVPKASDGRHGLCPKAGWTREGIDRGTHGKLECQLF